MQTPAALFALLVASCALARLGTAVSPLCTDTRSVPGLRLSVGPEYACGFTSEDVWCWGRTPAMYKSKIDLDPGLPSSDSRSLLPRVPLGTSSQGLSIEQVAAGTEHLCVRFNDGSLRCVGRNQNGQCGADTSPSFIPSENDELDPINFRDEEAAVLNVSAGSGLTCVLLGTEEVRCFGQNEDGTLGMGKTLNTIQLRDVLREFKAVDFGVPQLRVTSLSCGWRSCGVIFDNGRAKVWGSNERSMLGIYRGPARGSVGTRTSDLSDALPFLDVGHDAYHFVQIAAGRNQMCHLIESDTNPQDRKVFCFGANKPSHMFDDRGGILGVRIGAERDVGSQNGDHGEDAEDVARVDFPSGFVPERLSVGAGFQCALGMRSGTREAYCWGENLEGRLGTGSLDHVGLVPSEMGNAMVPVQLPDGYVPVDVQAGLGVACVLMEQEGAQASAGRKIACFGSNLHGRSGTGGVIQGGAPTSVGNNMLCINPDRFDGL